MSRDKVSQIDELKRPRWELPAEPGTAPIPKDHVRLYHQTSSDKNLDSIRHTGIKLSHAKGYEGPKAVYADEKGFYGKPGDKPTAEFSVHKSRWSKPFVSGDVSPKEIVSTHKDWHDTVRYIQKDPKMKDAVLKGEHDELLGNKDKYSKAIKFVKRQHAASMKEDAPAVNAGSGNIAGLGVGPKGEPGVSPKKQPKGNKSPSTSSVVMALVRRAPAKSIVESRRACDFAGKAVFEVSSTLFHNITHQKRKGKHWRTYLEEDDCYAELREYASKHKGPIIVQNERTGEMRYVRYT